jgi:glyoxylase-like metal-dependent hydrolase (beta-lactamase superfamily II)
MDMTATLRCGGFEVLVLQDGIFEAKPEVLVHAAGPEALARIQAARQGAGVRIVVNAFALRGPDGVSLVDAGTGDAWGPALGHLRQALPAAGIAPDQVRRVLLTHIHGDHALGLLDGESPWLPAAEVLVPEADLRFFTDPAAREAQPEARRGGFAIAERLQKAYGPRLRPIPDRPVAALPGVEALPLPGHTPGHTGFLLRGGDAPLLLWGDALHLLQEQAADPELGLVFDVDGAEALRTRRAVLARAADAGWVVAGAHVPGFSRVARSGEAFRILPA